MLSSCTYSTDAWTLDHELNGFVHHEYNRLSTSSSAAGIYVWRTVIELTRSNHALELDTFKVGLSDNIHYEQHI